MKVFKDGKEVKGAEVIYDTAGNVDTVRIDGVHYDASAFELKEGTASKVTKPADKKQGKLARIFNRKGQNKNPNSEVLSTEDLR